MYLPKVFREDDPALLSEVMRRHAFATLVTVHEGVPFASHLPFLHDDTGGGGGTLWGHMARANRQWRDFGEGEVLVSFQGPDCYVSPSAYRGELQVPTWNYVAVHAYGRPRVLSSEELRGVLRRLSDVHEEGREPRWHFDGLPGDFVDELLGELTGFAVEITRLEGKLKLSQNRDPEDRRGVLDALKGSADPEARAVAGWMDRVYSKEKV